MKHSPATSAPISMAFTGSKEWVGCFLRIMLLLLMISVVAGPGRVAFAATLEPDLSESQNHTTAVFPFHASTVVAPIFFAVKEESDSGSRSEGQKAIEEELKGLLKELKRLEKMAEEKIRKEILPLIKKEIERLKNKLREFRSKEGESDEQEPIKT